MFNFTHDERNSNYNYKGILFFIYQMDKYQKFNNIHWIDEDGENNLIYCCWKHKLVQLQEGSWALCNQIFPFIQQFPF